MLRDWQAGSKMRLIKIGISETPAAPRHQAAAEKGQRLSEIIDQFPSCFNALSDNHTNFPV